MQQTQPSEIWSKRTTNNPNITLSPQIINPYKTKTNSHNNNNKKTNVKEKKQTTTTVSKQPHFQPHFTPDSIQRIKIHLSQTLTHTFFLFFLFQKQNLQDRSNQTPHMYPSQNWQNYHYKLKKKRIEKKMGEFIYSPPNRGHLGSGKKRRRGRGRAAIGAGEKRSAASDVRRRPSPTRALLLGIGDGRRKVRNGCVARISPWHVWRSQLT